ncbi:MAG: type II secretion system protein [Nitrospinaceae bacterium]|jgi:prepilin-type N-terminal cleavage/methylation domain-containing protein|nr:type II secretion system protein [Nitrospina sp.]MBT5375429.1 type II secretion system protein [Nitrospinaceae bacterium]MBT5867931.1 type II secretion system protein [Nitrospinaceae bacterium]MBT6347194.1 type II secretion system protein [Nitrospina sp.]
MKRLTKNQSGFTLLEMILSISIVAIIVALGLGGVRLGVSARDVGEQKVDTYQRLRIIIEQLTQKLQSTYPVFISQKDGVPIGQGANSKKRILAFEGKSDSIRFVTFSPSMTAENTLSSSSHEVKFYIGEHPTTGKSGVILVERDISDGYIFSRMDSRSKTTQYFMLAENVTQLKFRYYQMKKLPPQEVDGPDKTISQFTGQWVNQAFMDPLEVNQSQSSQPNPVLAFEKANKTSLPRAVEITIGVTPAPKPGEEVLDEDLDTVFSPPIIVLLNSGMEFALPPVKEDENA